MLYGIVGLIMLVTWVLLAFVAAAPTGWVHLPLVAAVIAVTVAIAEQAPRPPTPGGRD